jgi:hypothetical protein
MNAQAELNKVLGSVTGGIETVIKASQSIGGLDQKMADKARETLKQKISVSKSNKEISSKLKAKLDVDTEDLIGGNK